MITLIATTIFATGGSVTDLQEPATEVATSIADRDPPVATLTEVMIRRAEQDPGGVAYEFVLADGAVATLTNGELFQRALATAEVFRADPWRRGPRSPALIVYPPGIEYLVALWACVLSSVPAVPAYPPPTPREQSLGRLRRQAADAGVRWVFAAEELEAVLQRAGDILPSGCDIVHPAPAGAAAGKPSLDATPSPLDVAVIQYTSGSTRAPRGVVLSHRNVVHNVAAIADLFALDRSSRCVVWLPPYHDMGLIGGIFTPLYVGFPIRLMSPMQFLKNPISWISQISTIGATVSGGPNFAYDLVVRQCRERSLTGIDLSRWKVAFNGGEPVRRATLDRFGRAFGPAGFDVLSFLPCYGLAEATLLVTGAHWRPPAGPDDRVSCGPPMAANQLAIIGTKTHKSLPEGCEGEIWVRGPSVSAGYWKGVGQPANAAPLRDLDGQPYLRTGDLGILRDGELVVTGRAADVLVCSGANYHASDIEYAATADDADIRPIAAAFLGENRDGEPPVVLVVERARGDRMPADVSARIRSSVLATLGLRVEEVAVCPPRTVPRTSSGKVQRGLCRQRYLAGEYDEWIVAQRPGHSRPPVPDEDAGDELAGFVAGVFGAVCEVADCDVHDDLSAIGGDSLRAATIANILERALGLPVSVEVVLMAGTPQGVTETILVQGASAGIARHELLRQLHAVAQAEGALR